MLHERLEREVLPLFTGRVVSFDLEVSQICATLMVRAWANGRAICQINGYIAAITAAHGLIVATRDTIPFQAAGLRCVNPLEGTGEVMPLDVTRPFQQVSITSPTGMNQVRIIAASHPLNVPELFSILRMRTFQEHHHAHATAAQHPAGHP